jgi:thioredoxin reductase (NADPH)
MIYDTLVIGGGVAGLTAALFAARRGLSTLVFVSDLPGGHLGNIESIEDFPGFPAGISGYELGPALQDQASGAGASLCSGEALALAASENFWTVASSVGDIDARTVIIAAGSRFRALGVPGEDRLLGKGVSHCASCDGPLLNGRPAVVIGAGDSAFQEAVVLAQMDVDVHVLLADSTLTAQQTYIDRATGLPGVTLQGVAHIEEIVGEGAVEGIRFRRQTAEESVLLPVGGVFIYAGLEPNTGFLDGTIELDPSGHIPADVWMRTALPGIFAAGDIRSNSASQAVTAAGDGATAAIAAWMYLRGLVQ